MSKENDSEWTLYIKPLSGWFDIDLRELWRYRDLIFLLVRRDFVAQYKQTILGPIWFFLQPLFSTIVFTIIFGKFAKIPTDGVPPFLFYLSGTVCWNYFSTCMINTSNTFITNASLFGKVYFPRLVIPVATVISSILTFLIQFLLFIIFLIYFGLKGSQIQVSIYALCLPFLLFQMACLGMGIGILISSLTTRYRDLTFLTNFGVQLWMYATPIIYPLSQVPAKYKALYMLNPIASIVETFRFVFIGTSSIEAKYIIMSWIITITILALGIILFSKIEKTFMDTV